MPRGRNNVNVLFNQASTGRVPGITYMVPGFKTMGQALGNQFKFGRITKHINYKQSRDGQTISQANSRTRKKFGITKKKDLQEIKEAIKAMMESILMVLENQVKEANYLNEHLPEIPTIKKQMECMKKYQKRMQWIWILVATGTCSVGWLVYWMLR